MDELTKDGFSRLEYLIIFFSILYGYVTISYINHFAELFKKIRQVKPHFVPLAWMVLFFTMLFSSWYSRWNIIDISLRGFHHFVMITIPVIIMTVISSLLSPPMPREDETLDMYNHFAKNRKPFYLSYLVYVVFEILCIVLYQSTEPDRLQILSFFGILFILGLLSKNKKYQFAISLVAIISFFSSFFIFSLP